jgi:dihydropteroate synthase type 2
MTVNLIDRHAVEPPARGLGVVRMNDQNRLLSPKIVGVVNITEDSFSDGGLYLEPRAAIARAKQLRTEGADVIELGPASSHPDSKAVNADQERERLEPVLDELAPLGFPLSIDSFLPETQRFAMSRGVAYLNDIEGFSRPEMYPELVAARCYLIVVHTIQRQGRATRVRTDAEGIWEIIDTFFAHRLATLQGAGIAANRIVIDPGLGYFLSSEPAPSVKVLGGIGQLRRRFGLPVLISASRKSFLRSLTDRGVDQIGPASLAAEIHAALAGVEYIRTHDVRALRDALTVLQALRDSNELTTGNPSDLQR